MIEWILGLTVAGAAGFFVLRGGARSRAKARLRRRVQDILGKRLGCLDRIEFLGVGNVGAVFAAGLRGPWVQEMGIQWQTSRPMPARVAVKLADFDNGQSRVKTLVKLAALIDERLEEEPEFALCPFLALGYWQQPRGRSYVVQVMPVIEGLNLNKLTAAGSAPADSLVELESILGTVLFLENAGYFTRNLDSENVMVQPDGRWMRIDFDNARQVDSMPLHRMTRLVRLAREIMEAMPASARTTSWNAAMQRLEATEKAPFKKWEKSGVPESERTKLITSTEELIEVLRTVRGQEYITGAAVGVA